MKYKGTLIAVKDMEKAKDFYKCVLGLEVVMDAGANVQLTDGIFLQTADSWAGFIQKPQSEIVFGNNAAELYFETNDIDAFVKKLEAFGNITYIHPVMEHSWGQRAVRFRDVDRHIIEVAESLSMVIKRFIGSGLTAEQTAKRMDVGIEYIKSVVQELPR